MNQRSSPKILYFPSPHNLIPFAESLISLTPKVSIVGNDLYADISSTEHLFGGEAKLIAKLESLLDLFKIISPWILTEKISWAKALCLKPKQLLKAGESQQLLFSLPIEYLSLCGDPLGLDKELTERNELVRFLRKIGLVFCGDFLKLPISSLAIRFGKLGTRLMDSLKGTHEPVLPHFTPHDPLYFSVDADNLFSLESLFYEIEQFLPLLEARLLGRGTLVKDIQLSFFLDNKQTKQENLSLSQPSRTASNIRRVLRESLSKQQFEAPLIRLSFEIIETLPTNPGQLNLLDDSEERHQDLLAFIHDMKNQFGDDQVGFPVIHPNLLPERSWTFVFQSNSSSYDYPDRSRPLFLFSKPIPFHPSSTWKLTELERISTNWWSSSILRHYFHAEHSQGEKLWVYFDPHTHKWFCHGSYD